MSEFRDFIQDAASRLCAQHCPQPVVEQAEEGRFPRELWDQLGQLGIPSVLVPEEQGGIGGTASDMCAAMEVLGSHAAPGPILETVLANRALALAGEPPLASPLAVVFVADPDDAGAGAPPAKAAGRKIAWAKDVAEIVAVARRAGRTVVARLDPVDGPVEPVRTISGEPAGRARLALDDARWADAGSAGEHGRLWRIASIGRCAQMLGALEWSLEATVQHAVDRVQFGRPIAKFQAVQHQLAGLAAAVAAASAIYSQARESLEEEGDALVAAARSRLGDAVDEVVAASHQIHAAIGFSKEHGLNFRTRRLMEWRDDFGSVNAWRLVLGRHLQGRTAGQVWEELTIR